MMTVSHEAVRDLLLGQATLRGLTLGHVITDTDHHLVQAAEPRRPGQFQLQVSPARGGVRPGVSGDGQLRREFFVPSLTFERRRRLRGDCGGF